MSASTRLSVDLPNRKPVTVVLVELPDGRIISRTADELPALELEEQAAVAAALGLPAPPASSGS